MTDSDLAMTVEKRMRSAWHEASPAVVAYLLLGPSAIEVVTLRVGRGHTGLTIIDREPISTATREQQENFVIVTLAGELGERLAEPISGYVEETSDETAALAVIASLDRIPLADRELLLAREAAPPNPILGDEPTAMRGVMWLAEQELLEAALHLAYLRARAGGMVNRHLPAIRAVALALLEQTTLTGTEVVALIAASQAAIQRPLLSPSPAPPNGETQSATTTTTCEPCSRMADDPGDLSRLERAERALRERRGAATARRGQDGPKGPLLPLHELLLPCCTTVSSRPLHSQSTACQTRGAPQLRRIDGGFWDMRLLRIAVAMSAAIAVLAAPVSAAPATPGDSVGGVGIRLSTNRVQYTVSVKGGPSAVIGSFLYKAIDFRLVIGGRATCFDIAGHRAAIGGWITKTTDPALLGQAYLVFFEDNGFPSALGQVGPDVVSQTYILPDQAELFDPPLPQGFPGTCPDAAATAHDAFDVQGNFVVGDR